MNMEQEDIWRAKMNHEKVPICQKLNLTIEEAAEYSNIGINKIRELTQQAMCPFTLYVGKKCLIKRQAFEEYINSIYTI